MPVAATVTIFSILSFGDQGYGDEIAYGAWMTVQISLFAYLLGFLIGLAVAIGKLTGGQVARGVLDVYTTVFRAIPELVLIILLYYSGNAALIALLEAVGVTGFQINGLIAAVVVLGIVQGAYQAEVIRAAIQAIPIGQIEAAKAYGMSPALLFRRVTLPAMLPHAIPGLANLWLNATKDSALISIVGFTELSQATRQAGVFVKYIQGNPLYLLVFYGIAALIYLAISMTSNQFFGFLERRMRRGQTRPA